jgi:hypothetical protein
MFGGIDFQNGEIHYVFDKKDEDMVLVEYPHGYVLDVGWYGDPPCYKINIIRDNDWHAPVEKYSAFTEEELYFELSKAIQKVKHESSTHRQLYEY